MLPSAYCTQTWMGKLVLFGEGQSQIGRIEQVRGTSVGVRQLPNLTLCTVERSQVKLAHVKPGACRGRGPPSVEGHFARSLPPLSDLPVCLHEPMPSVDYWPLSDTVAVFIYGDMAIELGPSDGNVAANLHGSATLLPKKKAASALCASILHACLQRTDWTLSNAITDLALAYLIQSYTVDRNWGALVEIYRISFHVHANGRTTMSRHACAKNWYRLGEVLEVLGNFFGAQNAYAQVEQLATALGETRTITLAQSAKQIAIKRALGVSNRAEALHHLQAQNAWRRQAHMYRCSGCQAPIAKLQRRMCSGCKRVWYCNKACQKAHWKQHKAGCVT